MMLLLLLFTVRPPFLFSYSACKVAVPGPFAQPAGEVGGPGTLAHAAVEVAVPRPLAHAAREIGVPSSLSYAACKVAIPSPFGGPVIVLVAVVDDTIVPIAPVVHHHPGFIVFTKGKSTGIGGDQKNSKVHA